MKKLVVITGASSGIGEALAIKFSALGHPLLLLARRLDRMQALRLPHCICKQIDIVNKDDMDAAIKEAETQFGETELLINNAGVMLLGNIADQNPKEWKQMFDVNVVGLLNGMHSVLSAMKTRQGGTIVNISSVAGRKTFPDHAAYCGTKFAVHAITENVREEVADSNVRVITIAPGAVETELLSHTTSDGIKAGYEDWKTAIGGALSPEDVANAIIYAFNQPQHVCIREIVLTATRQQP